MLNIKENSANFLGESLSWSILTNTCVLDNRDALKSRQKYEEILCFSLGRIWYL